MEQTIYPVAGAVKILGEKSSALRYWEEQFGLDIRRNPKGNRCYSTEDIQIFLCIQELKKKGYQLKEIKEVIPLLMQAAAPEEDKDRQLRFYEVLDRLMQELKRQRRQEAGGGDGRAEKTEGKKEEKDRQESAALNGSSCRPGCCRCGGRIRRITEKRGKGIMKEGVSGSSNLNPRHPLFNMFK